MAGLLDIFGTGGVETMGLLGMSPEDIEKSRSQAQTQALFALAGRMFQGGRGAASILEGLQQGQQAYNQAMQGGLQQKLQSAQLQEMLKKKQQEKTMRELVPQIFTTTTTPEQVTYEGMPSQFPARDDEGNLMPNMAIKPAQTTRSIDPNKLQSLAMMSPDPLAALASMSKLVPDLRKAGFVGGTQQEENPFLQFTTDPTIPTHLKNLANQYATSFQKGLIDPEKADQRAKELTEAIGRSQQFQQSQDTIKAAQEQTKAFQTAMTDLKERGLQNSAEYKQLQAQNTAALLALKTAASANKSLPASLQKSEDEDIQAINSYKATQKELFSPIKALTPYPVTNKPMLELGPVQNLRYQAANLTGDSTEASRAYADLQSSIKNAVNLKVSAEKGVQTDKDVLRFADALIAASGRNDTKATLEALKKFNDAIATAQENTVKLIDQRRKSQGVLPLFGDTNRNVNVNY